MLWIATQDKQSLINVKEVTVNGKKLKGVIGTKVRHDWSKDLGKYKSNARALDILSEIFMKIEENNGASVTFAMPEK